MPPQETLQHLQVVLVQSPVGSLLLSLGSWYMEDFVCDFQELSLCFPQSCRNPIIKSCCLQSQILWGFPVPLPDLLAGKPDVRLRIITTVKKENFFGIIVLQIVGGLAGRYRILFYHVCPSPSASLWLLLCVCVWLLVFGHGVSFFWTWGSSIILSMAVQHLITI